MNTYDYKFSPSSYKEYQQCGLRFRYRRIDRKPPESESSHHRWFGRIIHELSYLSVAEKEGNKDFIIREKPDRRYPVAVYKSIWKGEPLDELAEELIKQVGNVPYGTFFEGKIKSLKGTQEEITEGWRIQGEKMLRNGMRTLVGVKNKILELEQHIEWEYLGRKFHGYMDVLTEEDGKLVFYDLKTPWIKPSPKALSKDFQFFSYSHSLKQKYSLDYYPEGRWVHLKDGDIRPFSVTDEIIDMHEKESERLFAQMENSVFPSIFGSPLCQYCDFRNLCYGEDYKWD